MVFDLIAVKETLFKTCFAQKSSTKKASKENPKKYRQLCTR